MCKRMWIFANHKMENKKKGKYPYRMVACSFLLNDMCTNRPSALIESNFDNWFIHPDYSAQKNWIEYGLFCTPHSFDKIAGQKNAESVFDNCHFTLSRFAHAFVCVCVCFCLLVFCLIFISSYSLITSMYVSDFSMSCLEHEYATRFFFASYFDTWYDIIFENYIWCKNIVETGLNILIAWKIVWKLNGHFRTKKWYSVYIYLQEFGIHRAHLSTSNAHTFSLPPFFCHLRHI